MKKILSMGVASAVLALTAVAASADAVSGSYLKAEIVNETVGAGDNITVEVKLTQDGITDTAFIVKTEGLELVGEPTGAGSFIFNANTGMATFASATAVAKDTVVATFTYKVTAAEGEKVSFTLSDHTAYAGATNTDPVTAEVGAANDPADSDVVDSTDSTDESGDTSNGGTTNPGTGIALAIVPAVIAGAAVVVAAKKRK